ncbi:MAG TPA: hypothetical protein VHP37_19805 [Burkholderiales bacterium]|nr:hypothetical protein [Burkholderiales bacterium]
MGEPPDAGVAVADAILRYLALHPDAADSEEGIAEWWMPEMGIGTNAPAVAEALRSLHRNRLVERETLPDGRVIYRANSAIGN